MPNVSCTEPATTKDCGSADRTAATRAGSKPRGVDGRRASTSTGLSLEQKRLYI